MTTNITDLAFREDDYITVDTVVGAQKTAASISFEPHGVMLVEIGSPAEILFIPYGNIDRIHQNA